MQPVCVTLPSGSLPARALLRAFHLGFSRVSRDRRGPLAPSAARRRHLEGLLCLLQRQILHADYHPSALWLDRRELADLLFLLDQGLCTLREEGSFSETTIAAIEAADRFLYGLRQLVQPRRRPSSIHPAAQRQQQESLPVSAAAGA